MREAYINLGREEGTGEGKELRRKLQRLEKLNSRASQGKGSN